MRFILRRLGFYAIALWGAITLNFVLPRLMPGSPLDGLMSRLSPAQLAANPNMVENLRAYLNVQEEPFFQAYWTTWSRSSPGTSASRRRTSRRPSPTSSARTLPYSMALVGVGFMIAFVLGTCSGWSPRGAEAGSSTTSSRRR